jgi:hypothetical protein
VGYPVIHRTSDHIDLYNYFASFSFNGTASDWSNTQTITIGELASTVTPDTSPSSPSQNSTTTPDQTTEPTTNETSQTLQLAAIIGTAIAVVFVSTVSLVYFKKRKREAALK